MIHARTRAIFQRIPLNLEEGAAVVALSSNNGAVYALTNYGEIKSFIPTKSDPRVHAYGKFRWGECHSINISPELCCNGSTNL